MSRILFLVAYIYESLGFQKGPSFAAGEIVDADALKERLALSFDPSPEWLHGWMRSRVSHGVAKWADELPENYVEVDNSVVPVATTAPDAQSAQPAGDAAPAATTDAPKADAAPAAPQGDRAPPAKPVDATAGQPLPDFETMSRAELKRFADDRGIECDGRSKRDMIDAIKKALA